jgi:hypothetical protein
MSYGAIYPLSWWGQGIYNTIYWGSIYPATASAGVTDFIIRVEADNGILEALNCLGAAINSLPQADIGRLVYEPYAARVVADSGILEAQACTINDINNLIQ